MALDHQPVYYQNAFWGVTSFGIEQLKGGYYVEADRLNEQIDGLPDWPMHMARKAADHYYGHPRYFMDAFLVALAIHKTNQKPFKAGWYEIITRKFPRLRHDVDYAEVVVYDNNLPVTFQRLP